MVAISKSCCCCSRLVRSLFFPLFLVLAAAATAAFGGPAASEWTQQQREVEATARMYAGCHVYEVFPASWTEHQYLLAFVGARRGRIDLWRLGSFWENGAGGGNRFRWSPAQRRQQQQQMSKSSDVFVCPESEWAFQRFLREYDIPSQMIPEDMPTMMRSERPPPGIDGDLEQSPSSSLRRLGQFGGERRFDFGRYHSYEEIKAYIEDVATRNPTFVELFTLGKSFEQREIPMLKIGATSHEWGRRKSSMFIDAGIHAREWIAPAVALFFIDQLVKNASLAQLLHQVDFYIVPTLNPDGYEFTRTSDRLWRGTRSHRPHTRCVGVDPNRNFPHHWNETGTSSDPCSEIYPGEKALSEVECAQLAEFLQENKGLFGAYLTLHSYGNMILYPWGYAKQTYSHDHADLDRVGRAMADAIVAAGGEMYEVGQAADVLYPAAGASDDFAKSTGIKYVYTMELTRSHHGFIHPAHKILPTARQAVQGILTLANEVAKLSTVSSFGSRPLSPTADDGFSKH